MTFSDLSSPARLLLLSYLFAFLAFPFLTTAAFVAPHPAPEIVPKPIEPESPVEAPKGNGIGDGDTSPNQNPEVSNPNPLGGLTPSEGSAGTAQNPLSPKSGSEDDIEKLAELVHQVLEDAGSIFDFASSTATARPSQTITSLASTAAAASACAVYGTYSSLCSSLSPGWINEGPSVQASCACYSASYYVPDVFEVAAQECASYKCGGKACPIAASASEMIGLCSKNVIPARTSATFGEFKAAATAAATSTSSGPTSTPKATSAVTNESKGGKRRGGGKEAMVLLLAVTWAVLG